MWPRVAPGLPGDHPAHRTSRSSAPADRFLPPCDSELTLGHDACASSEAGVSGARAEMMLARRALTREREWRSAESSDHRGGTFGPSYAAALVDEIANVLDGWPGVRIERRSDGAALVRYGQMELGVLGRDRGVVQLLFSRPEHDELAERGDAEPADSTPIPTWSAAASGAGGRDRRARALRPSVRSSRYETMSAEAAGTVTTRAAGQAALETVGRDRGPRGRGAIERLSLCEITPAPKAAGVFSSSRDPRTALAYGESRSAARTLDTRLDTNARVPPNHPARPV
jgi:hypothetical protein